MMDVDWQEIKARYLEEVKKTTPEEYRRLYQCDFTPDPEEHHNTHRQRLFADHGLQYVAII
jgi:hypothetical protein